MPIKQVTCSICKAVVNKAQTYHVGKGERACKTHEGVVEKKDEQAEILRKKAEMETQKQIHKQSSSWGPQRDGHVEAGGIKCWVCMNPGLRQDEFFTRVLIEREKAAMIYGLVNPFDMNHPANKLNIGRCIFVLAKEKCEPALKYIREDMQVVVQFGGAIAICAQCCGTFKIDALPKVEYDQLVNGMVLYEAFVKPVVQAIAGSEMSKAN